MTILSKFSQNLKKCVNKVIEEEKNQRQDLFVLATSYIGQLKNRAIDMMKEADFHQMWVTKRGKMHSKRQRRTEMVLGIILLANGLW